MTCHPIVVLGCLQMSKYYFLTIICFLTFSKLFAQDSDSLKGLSFIERRNFSMYYPAGWIVDTSRRHHTSLILFDTVVNKSFRNVVKVNIRLSKSFEELTIEEMHEELLFPLVNKGECFISAKSKEFYDTKKVNRNGKYSLLIYDADACDVDVKVYVAFWNFEGGMYYIRMAIRHEDYERYKPMMDTIIDSFYIKK